MNYTYYTFCFMVNSWVTWTENINGTAVTKSYVFNCTSSDALIIKFFTKIHGDQQLRILIQYYLYGATIFVWCYIVLHLVCHNIFHVEHTVVNHNWSTGSLKNDTLIASVKYKYLTTLSAMACCSQASKKSKTNDRNFVYKRSSDYKLF